MALKLKVYTIFPEIFPGFLGFSLTGRALEEGIWSLETVNIRDYALDKHGSVDDTPCGGGAGMVMRADILGRALKANHRGRPDFGDESARAAADAGKSARTEQGKRDQRCLRTV